jgi:hypothetical protein
MVGLMLWVELPSWRPWFGLSIMMVKARRGVKIRVESGSSWKLLILNKSGRPFHWGFRPSEFPCPQHQQLLSEPPLNSQLSNININHEPQRANLVTTTPTKD